MNPALLGPARMGESVTLSILHVTHRTLGEDMTSGIECGFIDASLLEDHKPRRFTTDYREGYAFGRALHAALAVDGGDAG